MPLTKHLVTTFTLIISASGVSCNKPSDCFSFSNGLCGRMDSYGVTYEEPSDNFDWYPSPPEKRCYDSRTLDGPSCRDSTSVYYACLPDVSYCDRASQICKGGRGPLGGPCNDKGVCYGRYVCMDPTAKERRYDSTGICFNWHPKIGDACNMDTHQACINKDHNISCWQGKCEPDASKPGMSCSNPTGCVGDLECQDIDHILPYTACYTIHELGEVCDPSNYIICNSETSRCKDNECRPARGLPCSAPTGCGEIDDDCIRLSTFGGVAELADGGGICRQVVGEDEYCGGDRYCSDGLFCDYRLLRCHARGLHGTPCKSDGTCSEGHCEKPLEQEYNDVTALCRALEYSDGELADLIAKEEACENHGSSLVDCSTDYGDKCNAMEICQFEEAADPVDPLWPGQCLPFANTCNDCTTKTCCAALAHSGALPTGRSCKHDNGICFETESDPHGYCEHSSALSTQSIMSAASLIALALALI